VYRIFTRAVFGAVDTVRFTGCDPVVAPGDSTSVLDDDSSHVCSVTGAEASELLGNVEEDLVSELLST
jgi:hypothetical protein